MSQYRYCTIAFMLVLFGCAPLVERQTQPKPLPEQFGSLSSASSSDLGEEVSAHQVTGEGEQAAKQAEEPEQTTITERLLPTGLLEIGDANAPLTLLLFTEHHCRYCKEFQNKHFVTLYKDFIESRKLKLQIAILPLKKYTGSELSAIGLLCAAAQGKGIPMHELLFTLGASNTDTLMKEAATLKLDQTLFATCLTAPATAGLLELQASLARSLDVTLVPTFFLNGTKSVGLPYYPDLRGMIDAQLKIGD